MIFKTAFWQFQLLAFAFLWTMQASFSNKFVVGVGVGIIAMQCLDSFIDHYNNWSMKSYKLSCGCELKTNDPEGATQKCVHGNKFVKKEAD